MAVAVKVSHICNVTLRGLAKKKLTKSVLTAKME
jgi:hypothetical protein